MSDQRPNETYLGDGLYAKYNGLMIWLRAPQLGGDDQKVALEPQVFADLLRFAGKIWDKEKMIKILKESEE